MQPEPPRRLASYGAVGDRRFLRVGHKGAAALAPENTLASLAAALEQGVDMVEFDVVAAPDGELVLGHSREEIGPDAPGLGEALAFLAAEAPPGVRLDLDLKSQGCERDVVAVLRRHGLVERSLATSFVAESLRELRRLEPGLATGLSYPWDRHALSTRPAFAPVVQVGAAALRATLPHRIGRMVEAAQAGSAMLHFSVISPAVVARCHRRGVAVFAWTVDDPALLEQVVAMGVDGVISNDPRIFEFDEEPR